MSNFWGALQITVGDVSGKGVPAALFMGKSKALLDSYAMIGLSPAEIFEKTNNQLCKGNESELFVTCWLGILTFSTGELRFVSAGHPYPVLYHEGEFSYLREKPNFVLGGMEDFPYVEHTITLSKGDRIFVYSDGVTEATNSEKQLFEEERLLEAMKTTENLSAPDVLKKVREKIDEFVGDAEQFDDITMLQFIWK
ncbi:MAG: serine/threonine-protein phosphatase [Treponema sp.]|nr:serine/threonine-protein phosphatase [Treponema sp.]